MELRTKTVLQEAEEATGGRPGDYGRPLAHFSLTVSMINARFGTSFTPAEWAQMMMLDKMARFAFRGQRDSLVDVCGYARTIEMVEEDIVKGDREIPF